MTRQLKHLGNMERIADDLASLYNLLESATARLHKEIEDAHATLSGQAQLPPPVGETRADAAPVPPESASPPAGSVRSDILSRIEAADGALERGEARLLQRCLADIRTLVESL